MFDPQTANLIRQVPPLPDLNRERLPEELTRAFTTIVSFRLRLATAGAQAGLPNELRIQLDQFRRMAATYESMVVLLPERQDRRSAAFVAAQAHHLLHLAREAIASGASRPSALRPEAIAPEISALLLF